MHCGCAERRVTAGFQGSESFLSGSPKVSRVMCLGAGSVSDYKENPTRKDAVSFPRASRQGEWKEQEEASCPPSSSFPPVLVHRSENGSSMRPSAARRWTAGRRAGRPSCWAWRAGWCSRCSWITPSRWSWSRPPRRWCAAPCRYTEKRQGRGMLSGCDQVDSRMMRVGRVELPVVKGEAKEAGCELPLPRRESVKRGRDRRFSEGEDAGGKATLGIERRCFPPWQVGFPR